MRTATPCLCALFLLLVVGCSPDEKGTAGKAEKEKKAIASESPKQAAEEPESKPPPVEVAAEIKGLIPEASAMAREEMEKLATSPTAPRASDLDNKTLTFIFFTLKPKEHAEAKEQLQFLTSDPKPADLVREVCRAGMRDGKVTVPSGPMTFIHTDRITDFTCNVEGETAKGTVSFMVPDLYQGKVDYIAKRADGNWRIEEFILPAYDIYIVRNAEGTWGRLSLEQRIDTARVDIDAIDLHVSARKMVEIEGNETPIDETDAVLSRVGRYTEKRSKKPAAILVRIAVDDRASYGDFRRVVQACQENRFERFVLQCGTDSHPFHAPLAVPSEGLPHEDMLPPLTVRLRADHAGRMAQISMNDQSFGTSFRSLQNYIISILGDERGPGSVAEIAESELHCDDALQFKYVAEAYRAVSYYLDGEGEKVRLIEKVCPLGRLHAVEIDELEETDIFPFDIDPNEDAQEEAMEIELRPVPSIDR